MCPHTSHTTICVFEGELVIAGSQVLMLLIKLLYMSYFCMCPHTSHTTIYVLPYMRSSGVALVALVAVLATV
jgi:hypothetical protein